MLKLAKMSRFPFWLSASLRSWYYYILLGSQPDLFPLLLLELGRKAEGRSETL